MFWGCQVKSNKRLTQEKLDHGFHLTNAALDLESCRDENHVQLIICRQEGEFVLCNLRKNHVEQFNLDIHFSKGDKVVFTVKGNGNVHLTGTVDQDDYEDYDSAFDDSVIQENLLKKLQGTKKLGNQGKKQKSGEDSESDEDDSEDGEDEILDMSMENGVDNDDSEEDDDEDEDDDDDENDSESDEETKEPKAKQIKLEKSKKSKRNGVEENNEVKLDKKQKKQQKQQNEKKQEKQTKTDKSSTLEKSLAGGVKIQDLQVGSGAEAKAGKKVKVYYEGRLKSNNKVFDKTKSGPPFTFNLGRSEVIKGWDIGLVGMKVGGKRKITIPANMAYGARGAAPSIPPNAPLVFEVELKGVN